MTASTFLALLGASLLAYGVVMFMAWRREQATGNAGWIDVFWSFGAGGVAAAGALSAGNWRGLMVAALVLAWSWRLGFHLRSRTRGKTDDPRYAKLRAEWGDRAPREMLRFALIQAVFGAALAMTVILAAWSPATDLRVQDILALACIALGVAGEAWSDAQMQRFRADPANRGTICDAGLWSVSRHPNYFFEWLVWLAWPLFAVQAGGGYAWGWLTLFAPLCMYWLLRHVSGVPPLEDAMLRKYGGAYQDYQRRVSAFFPGWPRR